MECKSYIDLLLFLIMAKLFRSSIKATFNTITRNTSSKSLSNTYIPRRACLYVPGNDEKKLKKITKIDADCVILDCEDGVAQNRKDEARHTVCKILDELDFGRTEPIARVNAISSGIAEEDLKVILTAKNLPPTLMLPKVESKADIDWFSEKVKSSLQGREIEQPFRLIVFIESAIGLISLRDIFQHAVDSSKSGAPFVLEGVVFGSDDFCANIGAHRTQDAKELLYARQKIVCTAKAFELQAIDLVSIEFKDLNSLNEQALEGARMGFTGKQCIHPIQVPVVNEAFSPSEEKVEWATALIKAFEEHQYKGKGAFTFRDSMIDMPLLLQARNIVQMAETLHLHAPETTA